MGPAALLALGGIALIAVVAVLLVLKNVLYLGSPNEVLVFSGRKRQTADGKVVGYRILKGGRTIRIPLIETVDRMDLTNMIIELTVRNAYSKGGIPLTVQGVANIKVPGEEPLIQASLERFLGKSRGEIMQVARETLEGNLRGVLAILTPEQVNTDKEAFAVKLTEEAEHDLTNIGLVLDTLKIQNVTDDVGYLDSIGRMRSADIRRKAVEAESMAKAEQEEVKWINTERAEIARVEARIEVAKKETERRINDATTKREARIAEQRAEVLALISQAKGEIEMQKARIAQVSSQLQADVIEPAEAGRKRMEQSAKADAAQIVEQGRATAGVLTDLAKTYRGSGTNGRDVLLMQKLVPILKMVSGTIGDLHVDKLTVIGSGDGESSKGLASSLVRTNEEVKAATGVDLPKMLTSAFGGGERSKSTPPPLPRT